MSSVLPLTSSATLPQEHARASGSTGMVTFCLAQTRWQVCADRVDELFDSSGLKLTEWKRHGQTTIIKNGPHRTVYHLELPSGGYFLKHFKADDWKTKLRQLVTPCRAELEYHAVQRVAELGIPTFETIAIGQRQSIANLAVTDNFLISREITNVVSVQDYVNKAGQEMPAVIRHQLARQLGSIVGKLHNGHLLHRDLHSDNLLMKITADQQLQIWLIDLHAVSFVRQFNIRQIERNLALLIPSFFRHISKSDFLRFFHSYWKTLQEGTESSEQMAVNISCSKNNLYRKLTETFRKTALEVFLKQDKKWSRGNRRLIIADCDNIQCRGLAAIGKERLMALRDDPPQIKSTPFLQNIFSNGVIFREGLCKDFKARNAWEIGHAFLRRGFNTPRPIMFMSNQNDASLVTEDSTHLSTLSEKLKQGSTTQRDDISRALASRFAQLHTFGYDSSFRADDLCVDDSSGRQEIWFCNLDSVSHSSSLTTTQIITTFQKLYRDLTNSKLLSLSETLRFLKRYTSHNSSIHWKQFFQNFIE